MSKFIKDKKGFTAIESVIAMSFFLVFLFLVLGFFLFVYPQTSIGRDVHALATLAERQGGLTEENVEQFKTRLLSHSFIGSESDIAVHLTTEDERDAIGISVDADAEPDEYISRRENQLMTLIVTTPSNGATIASVAKYFGVSKRLNTYSFSEVIYSERY